MTRQRKCTACRLKVCVFILYEKFSSCVNTLVTCQPSTHEFCILLNKLSLNLTQKYSRTCQTAKSFLGGERQTCGTLSFPSSDC